MKLIEMSDEELINLITEINTLTYIPENTRLLIAEETNKPLDQIMPLDQVAFGWKVAEVLADRMNCYKRIASDATIGNLP